MRIVIIGGGNLSFVLAEALTRAGMPPVQEWTRAGGSGEVLAAADLYILAVSDRAIRGLKMDWGDAVVAHAAGSVALDAVQAPSRAVMYPLQTFTKGRSVDLREVPILIEGNNERSLAVVREVAGALSSRVLEVDTVRRLKLHTAAVFANNFVNHMYAAGEELACEAGFGFDILKPLIAETASKALAARSPRDVQTGPAVRNDFETRSRHAELLAPKPYLQNLYINISKNIWEISKKI